MKNKIIFKPKEELFKWISISNVFAKSMISSNDALEQFNRLTSIQRVDIKRIFDECDEKRRIKIPKSEDDYEWELSVMVDAHIIATEFNIDPLTVIMCINPVCKFNERIFFK